VGILACFAVSAHAGGPRFVAGTSYFDAGIAGQPIVWRGGQVSYFVDQGDLSASVDNALASATVAAAADVWNAVPTSGAILSSGGMLAEDVSGTNVIATSEGLVMPPDIMPGAVLTPVAVVFDRDGSVIDAFFGIDASDPNDCRNSGSIAIVDNLSTSGTIEHALILVNGRCAKTPQQLKQIRFQLIRAFGRVLGLDWSQANDGILTGPGVPSYQQLQGWPIMRPVDLDCNQLSTQCIPEPFQLRPDDVASVSRLYPVPTGSLVQRPGKIPTAQSTISIHGVVHFASGQGMQGVNIVARPVIPGVGLADDRYPVTSVSGFAFAGDQGSPVTGPGSQFGSVEAATEGVYDLTGIVLPVGENQADYQLTLEPVNPLYTGSQSVGPYTLGSPSPSGTMPTITIRGLSAGQSIEQDFTIPDSADDLQAGSGGSPADAAIIPLTGEWQSRIAGVGRAAWFAIPVKSGHHFTIETQALDQTSAPTENKLRSVLGIWSGVDPTNDQPVNATIAPFNGARVGVSGLGVDTVADGELLLGIADQRGDGRPDYTFHGRLLYADTVSPSRVPLAGGPITINGSGFRPGMTVSFGNNIRASITGITPTAIDAIVPASAVYTGSLDLILVDPATNGIAAIAGAISYGDASMDTLSVATPLPPVVFEQTTNPFTVRVFAPDQVTPIGGVPVSFSALAGSVDITACNTPVCSVLTTGDGYATAQVTALAPGPIRVLSSLSNGASLYAETNALSPPVIAALTAPIFLAPYAAWQWSPQVEVWNGQAPAANIAVAWSGLGLAAPVPAESVTNSNGMAALAITLGPWPAGMAATLSACLASSTSCVSFPVYTVHPEAEILTPVRGSFQQLRAGQPIAPVVLRLNAPGGQPVAGGVVTLTGSVRAWTPPCQPSKNCGQGRVLGTISLTGTSSVDGSVSLLPVLAGSGPEHLTGLSSAGASSFVPVDIEISP
jgi:hypothetical protein